MKGNPFEAPVKPPKARPRSTNPFEEDEVTIEFHKPAVAGQTQSPLFRSTNSRRYSPLDRTRISSTSTTPKSDSGISNPPSSTKRVIGGGSPHESLLSKARGQLFNSTRLTITSSGSDYARLDTSSESGSPFTHTGITDEESQIILSPMSGDATTSVGLHRYHNKTTNNSRLGREVGLNTSQRNNNTGVAVTTALTSTTIYDDNIGVELIETGIQYPTEGRSITPPRKPPKQSRELVLLRDSAGTSIEQQYQDSEDEDTGIADNDNVNSENNSGNDSDNNSDKDDGNNNTKNSQRSKKQKDRNKERKQKVKVPKTGVVCVDYTDENAVIRHLLSERVYGYPHTYGGRLSNFRYYIQYNHPILSIFFTHRLHPFTRKHRFIVFLCSLSFAACFAFILLATPLVPVIATCSNVCDCEVLNDDSTSTSVAAVADTFLHYTNQYTASSPSYDINPAAGGSSPPSQCVGGMNDGRECDAYNTICANYQSWMLSCLCGAVTTIYDSLLRFLATCSCLQGKKRYQNNCLGSRIKAIIEYFGSITLLIFVLLSIIFLIITMIICYYQHIAAYVLFIMFVSEIWSTGQWILWSAPYFLYKYKSDRQYFYEKMQRKSERLSKRGIQV